MELQEAINNEAFLYVLRTQDLPNIVSGKQRYMVNNNLYSMLPFVSKKKGIVLPRWLSWLEHFPINQKVGSSIPSQAHT